LIEAFGRVVLEALATGAVAIVPSYMKPLFGDACLYGEPAEVRPYIDRLYGDWPAYEAQSRAGSQLVGERFSYDTHVRRLTDLIGPPAAAPRTVDHPPPPVTDRPRVAIAPAAHAEDVDADAIETFPRVLDEMPAADRKRYVDLRVDGLLRSHGNAEIVIIDDSGDRTPASQERREPTGAPTRPGAGTRALSRLRRQARATVYALRRHRLARLKAGARAANVMLVELDEGEIALPVHTNATHAEPDQLPIALVVATDESLDPARVVRAVARHQQITSAFRAAFLAPRRWEAVASEHGMTIETLLPESAWTRLYGSGWVHYLQHRIDEACRVIHPVLVVRVGAGDDEDGRIDAVLAVLESARVRRRQGGS
jgi:hypothetical protein